MSEIENAELEDFCTKLEAFKATLSPPQLDLLEAILKIAWGATASETSLEHGFNGCFEPDDAELILKYKQGHHVMVPQLLPLSLIRSAGLIR